MIEPICLFCNYTQQSSAVQEQDGLQKVHDSTQSCGFCLRQVLWEKKRIKVIWDNGKIVLEMVLLETQTISGYN